MLCDLKKIRDHTPSFFRVPIRLAVVLGACVALLSAVTTVSANYAACTHGDAACASDSLWVDGITHKSYCCPEGAGVNLGSPPMCEGGSPAHCAATGTLSTLEPCSDTTLACTSGVGCETGAGIRQADFSLGFAATCPGSSSMRVLRAKVVATSGSFAYASWYDLDSWSNTMRRRELLSTQSSTCYQLTLPITSVNSNPGLRLKLQCAGSGTCSYTVIAVATCVAAETNACWVGPAPTHAVIPGQTLPDSAYTGIANTFIGNDQNQYCCNDISQKPSFGAYGTCKCGQLSHTQVRAMNVHLVIGSC